jgi:hypothetical protein
VTFHPVSADRPSFLQDAGQLRIAEYANGGPGKETGRNFVEARCCEYAVEWRIWRALRRRRPSALEMLIRYLPCTLIHIDCRAQGARQVLKAALGAGVSRKRSLRGYARRLGQEPTAFLSTAASQDPPFAAHCSMASGRITSAA